MDPFHVCQFAVLHNRVIESVYVLPTLSDVVSMQIPANCTIGALKGEITHKFQLNRSGSMQCGRLSRIAARNSLMGEPNQLNNYAFCCVSVCYANTAMVIRQRYPIIHSTFLYIHQNCNNRTNRTPTTTMPGAPDYAADRVRKECINNFIRNDLLIILLWRPIVRFDAA